MLASDSDPVPGKLVIKFSQQIVPLSITRGGSGISTGIAWLDSINLNYGLLEIRPLYPRPFNPSLAAWYRLMFPPEAPIVSLIDSFQSHSDVVHAEASYRLIPETPCDPNDSLFVLHSGPLSNQWFHSVLRTNSSPYVWNCGQGVVGDSNVLIAIVDPEGFAYTHPDLGDVRTGGPTNFFINSGEEALTYGDSLTGYVRGYQLRGDSLDSDNNGYLDDRHGYDFTDSLANHPDNNPWMDHDFYVPARWLQHGTLIAGVIGAMTNNAKGVSSRRGRSPDLPGICISDIRILRPNFRPRIATHRSASFPDRVSGIHLHSDEILYSIIDINGTNVPVQIASQILLE